MDMSELEIMIARSTVDKRVNNRQRSVGKFPNTEGKKNGGKRKEGSDGSPGVWVSGIFTIGFVWSADRRVWYLHL